MKMPLRFGKPILHGVFVLFNRDRVGGVEITKGIAGDAYNRAVQPILVKV